MICLALIPFCVLHASVGSSTFGDWPLFTQASILCHALNLLTLVNCIPLLQCVHELEGAFALVFKSSHFPNEAVAARRGSPLLVGIKVYRKDSIFVLDISLCGCLPCSARTHVTLTRCIGAYCAL